jgi:hypothetical protein
MKQSGLFIGLTLVITLWLALPLAAVSVVLTPKDGGQSPIAIGQLGPSGGTLSSPLPSPGNPSSPGSLTLTAPPGALMSQRDLAVYIDQRFTPRNTDLAGGLIVYQFSVDDFQDLFDSPLNLDVRYPLAEVAGLQAGTIDLFEYDFNAGIWRRMRANSFPAPLLSTTLAGKAMLGIGGIPQAGAMVAELWRLARPSFPMWFLLGGIFSTLLWALVESRGRGRKLMPAALAGVLVLCCAGLVFSTPDVAGNVPINNMRYVSSKDQQLFIVDGGVGKVVPGKCAVYEVERFKGKKDDNPRDPKNWDKASLTQYFPDSFETSTFGVNGVTSQKVTFPDLLKYDCAGFVFRNKTLIPLDPNTDGRAIRDQEYRVLTAQEKPMPGDVVVYTSGGAITHYAVVTMVDAQGNITEVESKWGRGQQFKGPPDKMPANYGTRSADVFRKK